MGTVHRALDLCHCENCIVGNIESCERVEGSCNDEDNDNDEDDENGEDMDEKDAQIVLSEVVSEGQVIALRTPSDAKESFYLCYVNELCWTDENAFDSYGHIILKGMQYLKCNYLSIVSEKNKNYVKYKRLTAVVFVIPEQMLSPFVNISKDFKLSLEERQFLDDCA